jgi:hypothetical protein
MKFIPLVAAALAIGLASAGASAQGSAQMAAPPGCEGQRFVFSTGEPPHEARVTLCSIKGATDADLVKMFDSAAAALSKNMKMAPEKRLDLVAQIKSKADALRPAGTAPAAAAAIAAPTSVADAAPTPPVRSADRPPEYTSLPPLPPPLPAMTTTVAAASASRTAGAKTLPASPPLSRPRLQIECVKVDDLGGSGPCSVIERETQVVVRADDAVPAETWLRFVRRGDTRAEVELAQLTRGKSVQLALPDEVCAGVNNSRVEIQVVRRAKPDSQGQVVDSLGPYLLHC